MVTALYLMSASAIPTGVVQTALLVSGYNLPMNTVYAQLERG